MSDCVFCKIVAREIPSYIVYEDPKYLGFLDIRPLSKGNSLIIPKEHFRWVYDVPTFGEYFEVAKKVALASIKGLKADWISFMTFGQDVPHAHIRVVPHYETGISEDSVNLHKYESYNPSEMQEIADQILKGGII